MPGSSGADDIRQCRGGGSIADCPSALVFQRTEDPETSDRDAMNTSEHALTPAQIVRFAERIDARKRLLMGEIRHVLARSSADQAADRLDGTGDSGDVAAASLLRDITESEIGRDVGEVRDAVAAQQRIAAGRYGICVDCGAAVPHARLDAYPTAKRCLACQERREKLRPPSFYTGR